MNIYYQNKTETNAIFITKGKSDCKLGAAKFVHQYITPMD